MVVGQKQYDDGESLSATPFLWMFKRVKKRAARDPGRCVGSMYGVRSPHSRSRGSKRCLMFPGWDVTVRIRGLQPVQFLGGLKIKLAYAERGCNAVCPSSTCVNWNAMPKSIVDQTGRISL